MLDNNIYIFYGDLFSVYINISSSKDVSDMIKKEVKEACYNAINKFGITKNYNQLIEITDKINLVSFLKENTDYIYSRKRIFVASSSSDEINENYKVECNKYLSGLMKENYDLVFGACDMGLMGESYNVACENNLKIIGVCPQLYREDINRLKCSKSIITNTLSERKESLIELSDIILILPGGTGTIDEFFTCLEMKKSKEINKPIIIYNVNGYYNKLIEFLDQVYENKFSIDMKKMYHVSYGVDDTLEYLKKEEISKQKNKQKKIC